jgi:hypothetical protein
MFPPENPQERCWLFLLAVGMTVGVFAIGYVLINGHSYEFNSSWEPPWGILISTYEFFVLCSGGLALATGAGRALDIPLVEVAGTKLLLAGIPALLVGIGTLAIEFFNPLHMGMNDVLSGGDFYRLAGESVFFYGLFLLLLVAESRAVERGGRFTSLLISLGAWGAALEGLFHTGTLLGRMEDLAYWGTFPWEGLTLSALALGGACLPLMVRFGSWLRGEPLPSNALPFNPGMGKILTLLVVTLGVVTASRLLAGSFILPAGGMRISPFLLSGPLAPNFWLFEVAGGILVPAFLLGKGRALTEKRIMAAGLLVIFGQFFAAYDRLLADQFGGGGRLAAESHRGFLAFVPCMPKSLVVAGAVFFFLFLWTIGEKIASAEETSSPEFPEPGPTGGMDREKIR